MKIVDSLFPSNAEDIALSKITIEYVQDLDCCQSESEIEEGCQTLTITTEDGGSGKFLRFNTGVAGWSINDEGDLEAIFKDFRNRLKC